MEYYIRGGVMLTSWKLEDHRTGQVIPYGSKFPEVLGDGKLHGIHCPSLNVTPRRSNSIAKFRCDRFLWQPARGASTYSSLKYSTLVRLFNEILPLII